MPFQQRFVAASHLRYIWLMKTATLPSVRVEPRLRTTMERLLAPGESLSSFVEHSIRESVERRLADAAFGKRALDSRAEAKASGVYYSSAQVLGDLRAGLKRARNRKSREK